jgi:hypothetical protein
MRPLTVPNLRPAEVGSPTSSEKKDMSKEDVASVDDLSRKVIGLRSKINRALTSLKVIDLNQPQIQNQQQQSEIPAFIPTSNLINRGLQEREFQRETEQLRLEVARLVASKKAGGQIEADFANFPTPLMARAMLEKDCRLVGRVRPVKTAANGGKTTVLKTVQLIVGPKDLKQIHQSVMT